VDKILEEKVSKDIAVYDTSVGQRNWVTVGSTEPSRPSGDVTLGPNTASGESPSNFYENRIGAAGLVQSRTSSPGTYPLMTLGFTADIVWIWKDTSEIPTLRHAFW